MNHERFLSSAVAVLATLFLIQNPAFSAVDYDRLLNAIQAKNHAEIEQALAEGADINNQIGYQTLLCAAIDKEDLEMVKFLIEKGADVNKATSLGDTPLLRAAERHSGPVVDYLLRKGANVNAQDVSGNTPILNLLAFESYKDDKKGILKVLKLLLAAGADLSISNNDGKTPSYIASVDYHYDPLLTSIFDSSDPAKEVDNALTTLEKQEKAEAKNRAAEQKKRIAEEKRRQAASKVQAQKEAKWLSTLAKKAPLNVIASSIDYNSIGTPEATIRVINAGKKTIDAYRVEIRCRDNFGRPVSGWGFKDRFIGISQDPLRYHEQSDDTWTLYGFDNATKFSAKILEVHFTDGTTWRPGKNHTRKK